MNDARMMAPFFELLANDTFFANARFADKFYGNTLFLRFLLNISPYLFLEWLGKAVIIKYFYSFIIQITCHACGIRQLGDASRENEPVIT
jgi:hypothetical protein